MGTTLTGTTPQDTYDSLIKVTDNGPLSGTAKYLSDGLGNDSKLALSTGNIGIGTTSPAATLHLDATGGATIRLQRTSASSNRFDVGTDGTNMEFNVRDTGAFTFSGGNVGIGTSAPVARFDTVAAVTGTYTTSTQQLVARIYNSPPDLGSGINSAFLSFQTTSDAGNANPVARIGVVGESYGSNNGSFVVATRDGSGVIEKMRVTSAGNVLIGRTTDNGSKLQVAGNTYSEGLYVATGQFVAAGSATTTFYTFSNVASNRVFLVSVRQSGASANSVVGMAFTYSGSLTSYNMAQDNTNPVLFLTLGASGLGIQLTTGSGYGSTTWEYTITQIK